MLIKTSLYNRNYYPIKINQLSEKILGNDKITESSDLYINGVNFDNRIGSLIKPFQSSDQITSISLKDSNKDFSGHIYLDSTIHTDSVDYGVFGILTGQQVDIKRHYVTIKIPSNSNRIDVFDEDREYYNIHSLVHIKFSMKDVSDWDLILKNLHDAGFSGYEIEDYDFYGNGIYGMMPNNPPPKECKDSNLYRAKLFLGNLEIQEKLETLDGAKMSVYKEDDNVFFELILPGRSLMSIYDMIGSYWSNMVQNPSMSHVQNFTLPIYQWPIGMSVILQMKTLAGTTPYKLNLKIFDKILFYVSIIVPENDDLQKSIKPIYNFIAKPMDQNYSALLCSPLVTKLVTNPNSIYNSEIRLIPFSLSTKTKTDDTGDGLYTFNSISQKNNDSNVINNYINFSTESLPVKRIAPQESFLGRSNDFNIYIDTTNIHSDYTNSLIIDYSYDNTNFILETDIEIRPDMPEGSVELNYVGNSMFFESAQMTSFCVVSGDYGCRKYDNITFSPKGEDIFYLKFRNLGEYETDILDIEMDNVYVYLDKLEKKENKTEDDLINIEFFEEYIDDCIFAHNKYYGQYTDTTEYTDEIINHRESLIDKSSITNYMSYKLWDFETPQVTILGTKDIEVRFKINFFKNTKNNVSGIPVIFKIKYKKRGSDEIFYKYLGNTQVFNFKPIIGNMSLMYDKSVEDIKYVRPNLHQTLFINLYKNLNFGEFHKDGGTRFPHGINIKRVELINYENSETFIDLNNFNIDQFQFPLSISDISSQTFNGFSYDITFPEEKMYKYKLRIYTNYQYIPYIDIPISTVATNVDIEEIIQFDKSNFYVRNNKYYLSLTKLQNKNRLITIINNSNINVNITEIETTTIYDKFGVSNLDITINNSIQFPFVLSNKNSLKLDLSFLGKDFGHYNGFIILKTNMGDIYLSIAAFVNTKYKDVFVMMENAKGTNFVSALNGADIDYIKLTNFGDEPSLLEINKLGYNQDDFLIANVTKLKPNAINYIENIFVPTSTGKKIGQIDFKIRDMLETYRLIDTDDEYVFKIQNSHILAEMIGISLTDHALPHFSRSVVDFGYIAVDKMQTVTRVDTFNIKNYGLTPFIITKITKSDFNSPFEIPLFNKNLPIKVDKEITLPIYINNKRFNFNKNIYMDVFKFEIQDLKSKKVFNYEIIVKIELTENNREYMSFNSEYIEFGYCEINNFKTDDITIKNFSTDKVTLRIEYEGDRELQSLENFNFNLQPNQTFTVPIYFYPHGIDSFSGVLKLNFNNGNFIKDIDLFGLGVDFKSPLITVENKMANYYRSLKDYLGNKKYI